MFHTNSGSDNIHLHEDDGWLDIDPENDKGKCCTLDIKIREAGKIEKSKGMYYALQLTLQEFYGVLKRNLDFFLAADIKPLCVILKRNETPIFVRRLRYMPMKFQQIARHIV